MSCVSHAFVRSKATIRRGLWGVAAGAACLVALHADTALAGYPFPGTLAVLEPSPDSEVQLGFLLTGISCDPETNEFTANAQAFLYGFGFFWAEPIHGTPILRNFVWSFDFSGLGTVFIFGSGGDFDWSLTLSDGTVVTGPVNMF